VRRALGAVPELYFRETVNLMPIIDEIVRIASLARKEGILALELQKSTIRHEPFRRAIQFVIDGFEPETVREILETEIDARREHEESRARVFEVAGAYAPTIGVLGAVLGLIHVLSMLSDPSKIGSGIAVAFVATVYGVGAANLFFLPWSSRLRRRAQERSQSGELVLIGILGIQEGLSPNFLGEKLRLYVQASDQDRRSEQGALEAQRSSGGEAVS
jgi:chemotaxis protein MotA